MQHTAQDNTTHDDTPSILQWYNHKQELGTHSINIHRKPPNWHWIMGMEDFSHASTTYSKQDYQKLIVVATRFTRSPTASCPQLRIIKQHKRFPDTAWIKNFLKNCLRNQKPKLTSPAWTSHAETGKTETNRSVKAKRQVHTPACSYKKTKLGTNQRKTANHITQ